MDKITLDYLKNHNVDAIGVGIIDFKQKKCFTKEFSKESLKDIYFDLASLTKVLSNSNFYFSYTQLMNDKLRLLLEHRASLPAWGLLSKSAWKEEILSYKIEKSETLYSDYSAIRFMLEAEKITSKKFKAEIFKNLSDEVKYWKDLDLLDTTLQNGYDKGLENFNKVHDPNARNIDDFVSHAGLFGTIKGVCDSLLKMNESLNLINRMKQETFDRRFVLGWDTAENIETTTAGKGCSNKTFGHLGFTGNSIWIDSSKDKGIVILSNTTKEYWFNRKDLNDFRRKLGEILWTENHLSLESYFY